MKLKGKVAIITGGSSGIGAAIAKRYAKEGAHVTITYRANEEGAIDVQKSSLLDSGEDIDYMQMDVRDRENVKEVFSKVYKYFNRIDILVNCAGINRTADFDKQTDDEWNEVIDVDLTGVFRCCQEILPYIKDNGRIINVGSLSGEYGGPRTPSYACAKGALAQLTHNLARFLGHRGICVNTLSPGVVGNEFTERTMSPEVKEMALSLMLIKRFARVEEMAGPALFLASDDSSYMTAQTLSVNGGAWV